MISFVTRYCVLAIGSGTLVCRSTTYVPSQCLSRRDAVLAVASARALDRQFHKFDSIRVFRTRAGVQTTNACPISTPKADSLLLPVKRLPRRSLGFRDLGARSACPSLDSAPDVSRRLRSVLSDYASSTPSARTPTSASRQASKHASSPVGLLLLVETRSLRRSHVLREQVLLVACWVVGGHGGLRVDRSEVDGCGCLGWLNTGWRGGICGFRGRVVDLRRRSVHGVQGAGESAALACSWWRWEAAACLCWWSGYGARLGRRRDGILGALGGACGCWLRDGSCAWDGCCCWLR
jgi:hypothetical protein